MHLYHILVCFVILESPFLGWRPELGNWLEVYRCGGCDRIEKQSSFFSGVEWNGWSCGMDFLSVPWRYRLVSSLLESVNTRMSEKTIFSLSKFQMVTFRVDKIIKLLQLSFRTCPDKENAIYVNSSVWNSGSVWIAKIGQDGFLVKQSTV